MTNVFLRNIQLGFTGSTTVMWIDDQIFTSKFLKYDKWITLTKRRKVEVDRQDVQFVMKSMTTSAWAYFNSRFFELALKMGKKFVILQSPYRENEGILKIDEEMPVEKKLAGAVLLKKLIELLTYRGIEQKHVDKIETYLF